MNLKIKNTTGIIFEGNTLSGNTFPVKDWIKSKVDGKWDANSKTWTVDAGLVNRWLSAGAIYEDKSQPQQAPAKKDNWKVWSKGGWELGEDY